MVITLLRSAHIVSPHSALKLYSVHITLWCLYARHFAVWSYGAHMVYGALYGVHFVCAAHMVVILLCSVHMVTILVYGSHMVVVLVCANDCVGDNAHVTVTMWWSFWCVLVIVLAITST